MSCSNEPLSWSGERWQKALATYAYPAAHLVRDEAGEERLAGLKLRMEPALNGEITGPKLETFHGRLLRSSDGNDRKHGVLSVVYWGNIETSKGRRLGYALPRARRVAENIGFYESDLAEAREAILEEQLGRALVAYRRVPWIGASFASKMVAFASPRTAGVLDRVICKAVTGLRGLDGVNARFFRNGLGDAETAVIYELWCRYCTKIAADLNDRLVVRSQFSGDIEAWRAIDVERAIFAGARTGKWQLNTTSS